MIPRVPEDSPKGLPEMDEQPIRVAIIACEPSADRQGAALLEALREREAPRLVHAWGIGGAHLRAAGAEIVHDSDSRATIGLVAALANIPYGLKVRADIKRRLAADPPDVLVLIDAGAFNMPLGRWAKAQRLCPIFYYFPSGSWRKTPHKGHRLMAECADVVVTPFAWSETLLRNAGADVHFVGHPLLDLVRPSLSGEAFYERFGLDPLQPVVALLPGSRQMEIQQMLPPMLGAAGEIARRIPGVQFALALAPSAPRRMVERIIRREQGPGGRAARLHLLMSQAGGKIVQIAHSTLTQTLPPPRTVLATNEGLTLPPPALAEDENPVGHREKPAPAHAPLVIVEDMTYDVLACSDLVITKSGTSTLEAAILQKPMIVVYRVPPVVALEGRVRWKKLGIAHIGMPNILAGERVVPELLQDAVTPEAIADLAVGMLLQPERLLAVKERLGALMRNTLGEPGAVRRAAAMLQALIGRRDSL